MRSESKNFAVLLAASAAAAIGLGGCSSKPPGCADEEVIATMRNLVLGQGNGDPTIQAALAATKLGLSEVVSEGYQAEAKRQMCRAKLAISLPSGESFSQVIQYSTQRTVDDKSNFLLTVDDAQTIQLIARTSIGKAATDQRWGGTWQGEYRCSASARPTDPGAEAYSEQAVAEVKDGDITLPLSGRDGVKELVGRINAREGSFALQVPVNKARNILVGLHGPAVPDALSGTGEVKDIFEGMNGLRLRTCEIRLQRGKLPPSPVADSGAAWDWQGTFVGQGEGEVTLAVGPARSDGKFPVSLGTSTAKTGGGCGGSIDGLGTVVGENLQFAATAEGMSCEAVIKRAGAEVEVQEGKGCNMFHGAACGFSASLRKTK